MKYYDEIKNELIDIEVYKRVKDYSKNKCELEGYYKIGKMLTEAGKHYGEGIIKEYSIKLMSELGKRYNERTLRRIRQFYLLFEKLKWSTVSTKITWSHYCELLPIENIDKINYYICISQEQNLSVRQLREKIKSNEYERLDDNTKNKLINKEETDVRDFVKNPIIIRNKNNYEIISERILQKIILEDIENFLTELGEGFTFVKSEYKIKIGGRFNYIDILLFNYKYNCFIAIELKITELKKEHIGQIEVYMNYIDKNVRDMYQDRTIGIIICRKDNQYITGYCSDERIISREYQII